jgi:hypothetical protein
VYTSNISPYDVRGGFIHGFGTDPDWWATFALVLIILIMLEVAFKAGKQYLRRTLVTRSWRKNEAGPRQSEDSWREDELQREKESKSGTPSWRRPWQRRKKMGNEWDVGLWQEIEAEGGLSEMVLALNAGFDGPCAREGDDDV